jgi:hypothetical protein
MTERLPKSAMALLDALAKGHPDRGACATSDAGGHDADLLVAHDLAHRGPDGLAITPAGRARLARALAGGADVDPFRAQHLSLARRLVATPQGPADVAFDDAESPLVWLARRKGRDGHPLIEAVQLQAGERLRGDFTRAQLTPRVTSSWDASVARGRRGGAGHASFADVVIAARDRVRRALDAVGPEFAGLLLDVCCFLKGLEDVERERRWPPRSAKVVVQLGLDRLARHYGLAGEARGPDRAAIRTWLDPDSAFVVDGG